MNPAPRALLVAGGPSSEHDVSLMSAAGFTEALQALGWTIHPLTIGRSGRWNLRTPHEAADALAWPPEVPDRDAAAVASGTPLEVLSALVAPPDVTILSLHGPFGEDGTLQGFFHTLGWPLVGPGVAAAALSADKLQFKRLMRGAGLPTPRWWVPDEEPAPELGWPRFVKPRGLGSSDGVSRVAAEDELHEALNRARAADPHGAGCFVEEGVKGRELTCAVLGKGERAVALPLIEIVPASGTWFDRDVKYRPGAAREVCPARVDHDLAERLSALALATHRLAGCSGVSRTDFIVDDARQPWILEINTLPGMTSNSLVPQAARQAGLTLPALVEELIRQARETGR